MAIRHKEKNNTITYEKFEEDNKLKIEVTNITPYIFECTNGLPGYRVDGKLNLLGNKKDFKAFHLPIPSRIMNKFGNEFINYFLNKDCKTTTDKIPEKIKLSNGHMDYDLKTLKKYINEFRVLINDRTLQVITEDYRPLLEYIPLLLHSHGYLNPCRIESCVKNIGFLHSYIHCDERHTLFLMPQPLIFIDQPKHILRRIEDEILRFYQKEDADDFSLLKYQHIFYNFVSSNRSFRNIIIKRNYSDSYKINMLDRHIGNGYREPDDDEFLKFKIDHPSRLETIFKLVTSENKIEEIKEEFTNRAIEFVNDHNKQCEKRS